jgi:hypothetical protein
MRPAVGVGLGERRGPTPHIDRRSGQSYVPAPTIDHAKLEVVHSCLPLGAITAGAVDQCYITSVSWTSRLRKPLHLTDGRTIRTIADARDMILALPDRDQARPQWQSLDGLLVSAAHSANPTLIASITNRLRDALAFHHKLSVVTGASIAEQIPKKPAAKSVRRRRRRRGLV